MKNKKNTSGQKTGQKLVLASATMAALTLPLAFASPSVAIERAEYNMHATQEKGIQQWQVEGIERVFGNGDTLAFAKNHPNWTGINPDGTWSLKFPAKYWMDDFAEQFVFKADYLEEASDFGSIHTSNFWYKSYRQLYQFPYQGDYSLAGLFPDLQSAMNNGTSDGGIFEPGKLQNELNRIMEKRDKNGTSVQVWKNSPWAQWEQKAAETNQLAKQLQDEQDKLEAKLKNNTALADLINLNKEIEQLNNSNQSTLDQKLAQLKTLNNEAKAAEEKLKAAEADAAANATPGQANPTELENQLNNAKQTLQSKLDEVNTAKATYEPIINDYKAKKSVYDTQLNQIKQEINQLQGQIDALPKDNATGYEEADTQSKNLQTKVDALKAEYAKVDSEYKSVDAKHKELTNQISALEQAYKAEEKNVEKLNAQAEELKKNADANNTKLTSEYASAKAAYDKASTAQKNLEDEINQIKADVANKNAEYKNKYDQIYNKLDSSYQNEVLEFNKKNKELQTLLEMRKIEYQTVNEEYQEVWKAFEACVKTINEHATTTGYMPTFEARGAQISQDPVQMWKLKNYKKIPQVWRVWTLACYPMRPTELIDVNLKPNLPTVPELDKVVDPSIKLDPAVQAPTEPTKVQTPETVTVPEWKAPTLEAPVAPEAVPVVPQVPEAPRDDIINKVNTAATDAENAINALENLKPEEKTKFLNDVKTEQAAAIKNIKDAANRTAAESAGDLGVEKINGVVAKAKAQDAANLKAAQEKANGQIDNKATEVKNYLDASNLTPEQKKPFEQEIAQAVADAKTNIADAKTIPAVETAAQNGIDALDAIKSRISDNIDANKQLDLDKTKAKADIDQYAADAKKKIDGFNHLKPEQKEEFKKEIDAEATKAKNAIDAATDKKGVDQAVVDGKAAIDKVVDRASKAEEAAKEALDLEKGKAKADIDQYAADAKKKIDGFDHLKPEQKEEFKKEIDAEATKAKNAIDAATDKNGGCS